MILLSTASPWRIAPLTFQPGSYYVEAGTAGAALHNNDASQMTVQTVPNPRPWDPAQDWNGRSILLCRSGGFGDLLFLTPLLRAMRAKWPRVSLSFAATPHCHDALMDLPELDALLAYPVPQADLERYDAVLWFEGVIEWDPRAREVDSVQLHADFAGVELTEGRQMHFRAHLRHLESMRHRFPRLMVEMKAPDSNRREQRILVSASDPPFSPLPPVQNQKRRLPRIGIQCSASAKCRTYPASRLGELLQALPTHWQLVLFDTPRPLEKDESCPTMISLPTQQPPLSFAQSCAVLADCDVVIAPDSALVHVAGALGIPTIGLYGPFPWQLRTIHAPRTVGLNGTNCKLAPCFHHDRESYFPAHGPCHKTGRCEALYSIEPLHIVSEVKKLLGST